MRQPGKPRRAKLLELADAVLSGRDCEVVVALRLVGLCQKQAVT